jgi:hypothetical protein
MPVLLVLPEFRTCIEGGAVVSEESGEYGEFHGHPWSDDVEEVEEEDDDDDDDDTSPAADPPTTHPSTMTEEEVPRRADTAPPRPRAARGTRDLARSDASSERRDLDGI